MEKSENISPDTRGCESGDDARERTLMAAEKLFAEKGLDGVSIRQITSAANCNVAAVNYYFGGKQKLYIEVCRQRLDLLRELRISRIRQVMAAGNHKVTLEELLTAFAEAFMEPLIGQEYGCHTLKLFIREMIDKNLPEGMLFELLIGPIIEELLKALKVVCPELSKQDALLSIQSLAAQLARVATIQNLVSDEKIKKSPLFDLELNLKHIVKFSAAGIRAYTKNANENEDQ
ncbi:MAG TPA: TetR/AcrR family transcriptional regulator [Phycisphaerales bacterium]|nr:TetR/AcrR family transcriptional regulator [Phycisphaerales bacterium]